MHGRLPFNAGLSDISGRHLAGYDVFKATHCQLGIRELEVLQDEMGES